MLHPSLLPPVGVEPLDPLLVADIAAGLARTIPPDATTGPVLATDRYDAWLVDVPAEHTWPVRPDHRVGAAHVVDGAVVERWARSLDATPITRLARAGETISIGLGTRELVNESCRTARVVYVSSPPALRAPTFHELRPDDAAPSLRLVS